METGDRFAALQELHAPAWRWALACADGRRELAEDALQSSYLVLLEGRARWRAESSLRTFVFALIRRQMRGLQRRERLRALLLGRWLGSTEDEPVSAGDASERELDARRLQAALAELPRRQREVLVLVYQAECTVAEAASILAIGLGSARTHFARGKQALRQRFAIHEGDSS